MTWAPSIDNFPPYGFTCEIFASEGKTLPLPLQPQDRPVYMDLVSDLVDELSSHVWPRYNRPSRTWVGDAKANAVELTQADFQLGEQLAEFFKAPIRSCVATGNALQQHEQFYLEEDGFVVDHQSADKDFLDWGDSFVRYDGVLPPALYKDLARDFAGDGYLTSGSLAQDLKEQMQRPRPYQMALLFGRPDYHYKYAHTACTPSMVSGHALQSAISGCYVFLKYQGVFAQFPGASDYWAQFMVDVGDRRVFAGVHYPSDSVSSWFCALRAAKVIFKNQASEARAFLWKAISQKSIVYQHLKAYAEAHRNSPHDQLLKWLEAEAQSS